ncbi:MBL fold metallo-hydrolase [Pseudobacteroides cellulosolvens]|uniref:Metallo-beta-lactamase domain-containing protein n=1 Tax=Pseudobacteroides cellulosolvens ATCC 35603 = DSM 2933 TaxID=398512 RepID=A0A0L6JWD1_9FIRM|nr:MBL fold metallo-hydrolase [Pseudobacteroides cellulosolvens]KNY29925.1 hypothetical protein Bccel_5202 [Pseudobacteroides cellulosolvens ATCC 35603 = DSM 2933]
MSIIKIKLLGIGSLEIKFEDFSVFIDAFNNYLTPPKLSSKDIVLFSHSDGDHFSAPKILNSTTNNLIIGPPSIAYPLLANTSLNPDYLKIVYPPNISSPIELEVDKLKIKVYQTKHFIDWEPDHISFLLKYKEKKIYITGDSHAFYFEDPEVYNLDALVYSLVIKDMVMGKMCSREASNLHIQELGEIQERLKPRYIIGNHLINCDWTVNVKDIKNEIEGREVRNIIIPEFCYEELLL